MFLWEPYEPSDQFHHQYLQSRRDEKEEKERRILGCNTFHHWKYLIRSYRRGFHHCFPSKSVKKNY